MVKINNLPYYLSHFIKKNPLSDIDLFLGPLTWNHPVVELHWEGSAPAAYAAGLFFFKVDKRKGGGGDRRWMIKFLNVNIISFAKVNRAHG